MMGKGCCRLSKPIFSRRQISRRLVGCPGINLSCLRAVLEPDLLIFLPNSSLAPNQPVSKSLRAPLTVEMPSHFLELSIPKLVVWVGQPVDGHVTLNLETDSLIKNFRVRLLGEIMTSRLEGELATSERCTSVDLSDFVLGDAQFTRLPAGRRRYPFRFLLPADSSGSLSYKGKNSDSLEKNRYEIVYRVEAELELDSIRLPLECPSPLVYNTKAVQGICVLEHSTLSEFASLFSSPSCLETVSHVPGQRKAFQELNYSIVLDKLYYNPGETFPVKISIINNLKGTIADISITLMKLSKYSVDDEEEEVYDAIFHEEIDAKIQSGEKKLLEARVAVAGDAPVTTSPVHSRKIHVSYLLLAQIREPQIELCSADVIILHPEDI